MKALETLSPKTHPDTCTWLIYNFRRFKDPLKISGAGYYSQFFPSPTDSLPLFFFKKNVFYIAGIL